MSDKGTVGIVGFGVMGAAIGLNAAASGYRVVYKELNEELVRSMYDKWVAAFLDKRVEKGKMTRQQADDIAGRITGTTSYDDLAGCDLVIEAAVEKMDLKQQIFADLSQVCGPDTILASNTSTFLIEKLMERASAPQRTAGLHYFFPANVNRLVEVIRQKATDDTTYQRLMDFARANGKVPITVRDFPGFAINPIFIASYLVLDGFLDKGANVATLEAVSQQALGVKFGIMWVQNGSGLGTCYHAGVSMEQYLADSDMGYPRVPSALKRQFEAGQPWNLQDGPVSQDTALCDTIRRQLLGTIFAVAAWLIEKQVVSVADLELGVKTALAWPKGPFGMMNEMGMDQAGRLMAEAAEAGHIKVPPAFDGKLPAPWPLD